MSEAEQYELLRRTSRALGELKLVIAGIKLAQDGLADALDAEPELAPELVATMNALVDAQDAVLRAHTYMIERIAARFGLDPDSV